jgi:hypothetical protein
MVVGTALIAASAACGDNGPLLAGGGELEVRLATQPSDVQAVHILVTGIGFDMINADMVSSNGVWSVSLLNITPATGLTVAAFAYSDLQEQNLIYQGTRTGVAVSLGNLTVVDITLLPNGGGGIGINTPPHITNLSHPDTLPSNIPVALSAIAVDPDPGASLTYVWNTNFGSFDSSVYVGMSSGAQVNPVYFPPEGFTGVVIIQLTVTDDQGASTTTAFSIAVGAGLEVVAHFDVLPLLTINSVERQELQPSASTRISYTLEYPNMDGVQPSTHVVASWGTSPSCAGGFGAYTADMVLSQGNPSSQTVVYTAPAEFPLNTDRDCTLTYVLTDDAGATLFSQVVVWINPPAHVMFVSSGTRSPQFVDEADADAFCQGLADVAVGNRLLPQGTYRALLSFGGTALQADLSDLPYVLFDGTPVAANTAQLFSGRPLLAGIVWDEGRGNRTNQLVFTGALSDGSAAGLPGPTANCQDWSTTDDGAVAMVGRAGATDSGWVQLQGLACSQQAAVYCVLEFPLD